MKKRNFNFIAVTSKVGHFFGEGELDGAAIITKLLKTVYKKEDAEIQSILKYGKIVKEGETSTDVATPENILATITALDSKRIGSFKEATEKESYAKGYGKAKGETLAEREKKAKEKYGVESDLTGEELDDFIVAEQLKKAGKVDVTNESEIKKSSAFQAMEKKLLKELKEAKEAGENKVKELETTFKKEGTFTKVGQSAMDILDGLKPILPTNATVAATRRKDFLNELKEYDYEEKDGKTLVSKDGKLLEDGHGNTLSWEDHVKGIAGNRYEFAVNNGGDNAGDKKDANGKTPTAYPAGITKPKNIDELSATINKGKLTPAEKRVVIDEYEARNVAK